MRSSYSWLYRTCCNPSCWLSALKMFINTYASASTRRSQCRPMRPQRDGPTVPIAHSVSPRHHRDWKRALNACGSCVECTTQNESKCYRKTIRLSDKNTSIQPQTDALQCPHTIPLNPGGERALLLQSDKYDFSMERIRFCSSIIITKTNVGNMIPNWIGMIRSKFGCVGSNLNAERRIVYECDGSLSPWLYSIQKLCSTLSRLIIRQNRIFAPKLKNESI